ncbi:PHP domain-containing protein [Cellulomonas carbonis]|uniref:Metal-dependent phosphoesterase n=1 Tax=Cellulomonas carbonis T26 TaxID=947969 RepID=A0A0A0BS13_9CELL|nr:PHP domain-containing protein [Cellulomonas carbonis]KGM09949.1 metal-dependent phosphoesterase [Cellulomonas carbonis T26]
MRIDLHTHSYVSDGTDAPAALVADAARAGLDVVALTDHDTTAGWDEAAAAAREHGVVLVPGMELSCRAGGTSVHLLSYLHDPEDAALLAEAEETRGSRLRRAHRMVELLAADLDITWADVEAQTEPGTTVGRPHVADALVALGHVPDRSAAFATLLAAGSPYYVPHHAPDAVRAVELVRAAGGVPVLAHPRASERGAVVPEAVIRRMVDAGLAGLEVDHRDHTGSQREHLRGLAQSLGLLVTGSSDYHGAGKPNLLGENLTSPDVLQAIEDQGRRKVVRP